jgi:hypothetical protein
MAEVTVTQNEILRTICGRNRYTQVALNNRNSSEETERASTVYKRISQRGSPIITALGSYDTDMHELNTRPKQTPHLQITSRLQATFE